MASNKIEVSKDPGVALAVGINCFGQLGVGEDWPERKKPALLKKGSLEGKQVVLVAAGGMHSAVLDSEGKVHTFGCNDEGALGRQAANEEDAALPGLAEGLEGIRVVAVTAGDSHTAALDADGVVYACGCFRDDDGALAFSDDTLIQKTFRQVFPPPASEATTRAPKRAKLEPLKASQIASGQDHIVILTTTGQVYTMGTGKQGQLGRISERQSDRNSARDVKGETPDFIKSKRTTVQFVRKILVPQPVRARGMRHVKAISCGNWATFAIDADGAVWAWGLNNFGQLGIDGSDLMVFAPRKASKLSALSPTRIEAGQHHTLALTADGKVYALGRGDCGRLGVTSADGGKNDTPLVIEKLSSEKIIKIAAGNCVSYAASSTGKGFAWGFGENLQLTNGEEEDANEPIEMTGKQLETRKVIQISGGGQHTLVLAKDA